VRLCGSLWFGSGPAGCAGNCKSKPQPGHAEGRGSSVPDANAWPCPDDVSICGPFGPSGGCCHAGPCHQWWRRSYFPECPGVTLPRPEPWHCSARRSNARCTANGDVAGRVSWQPHTDAVADPVAWYLGSHVFAHGNLNPCPGRDAVADLDLCPRTDAVADLNTHRYFVSRSRPDFASDLDADGHAYGHADADRFADPHAHLDADGHARTPQADRLFLQSRRKL
jgi:hypothetical protein